VFAVVRYDTKREKPGKITAVSTLLPPLGIHLPVSLQAKDAAALFIINKIAPKLTRHPNSIPTAKERK